MIETAQGLSALDEICAVPGLTGVYVGPADLAISLGLRAGRRVDHPAVRDAMTRVQATASAAGLVTGIHAGAGKLGKAMAQLGFRMITLASESQALRRGAAEHLAEATTQADQKLRPRPQRDTSEQRSRRAGDRCRARPGRGDRQAAARGRIPCRGVRSAGRRSDGQRGSARRRRCHRDTTRRDVRRQWAAAVATAVERFGALTDLVNNAGVLHRASLADETPAGFEGSWRVNCLGPFLGIRAALRITCARPRARRS